MPCFASSPLRCIFPTSCPPTVSITAGGLFEPSTFAWSALHRVSLLFVSNCPPLSSVFSVRLCQAWCSFRMHCLWNLSSDASLAFLLLFLRMFSHDSAIIHSWQLLNLWLTEWIAQRSITSFDGINEPLEMHSIIKNTLMSHIMFKRGEVNLILNAEEILSLLLKILSKQFLRDTCNSNKQTLPVCRQSWWTFVN